MLASRVIRPVKAGPRCRKCINFFSSSSFLSYFLDLLAEEQVAIFYGPATLSRIPASLEVGWRLEGKERKGMKRRWPFGSSEVGTNICITLIAIKDELS